MRLQPSAVLNHVHPGPQYIPSDVAHDLEDMLSSEGGAASIKIRYRPYDWSVTVVETPV